MRTHPPFLAPPFRLRLCPPAQEAMAYATEKKIIYFDTSAKTGANINNIFVEIGAWAESYGVVE